MRVSKSELKFNKVLANKLDHKDYSIDDYEPVELFTANRFDLAAKLVFLRLRSKLGSGGFGEKIYIEHIKAMNGLLEADGSNKIGKEQFIESFVNVYDSITKKGFDPRYALPLSSGGDLLDGSHRLASALFAGLTVKAINTDIPSLRLNYEFFRERGLPEVFMDAMAQEYLRYRNKLAIVLVWPTAGQENVQKIEAILKKSGEVVYKKDIELKRNGPVLLIKEAYSGEAWLGTVKDDFQGARNKASWCFAKEGPLNVYLYDTTSDLVELKDKIRKIIGEGKHAVHMTDTMEEASKLSHLLFNQNAVHWLNNALIRDFKWFESLRQSFKQMVEQNNKMEGGFCLIGSSTLGLYGLREPNDIDFIHGGTGFIDTGYEIINDNTEDLSLYPNSLEELLLDPRCHFEVDGICYISLPIIEKQKQKRGSKIDILDLKLINSLSKSDVYKTPWREKIKLFKNPSYLKGRLKFYLLKIRYYLTKFKMGWR